MNQYLINMLKVGRSNTGLTQAQVAKMIGIKGNTLSGYETGASEPDIDTYIKLCKIYNLDYVSILEKAYNLKPEELKLSVEEEKVIKKYRSLSSYDKETVDLMIDRLCVKEENTPYVSIPYYGHIASAGTGQYLFDDIPFEMKKVEMDIYSKNADFAIGVNGDSMEPEYHDGDIVLVKKQEEIPNGYVGLFIHNGEAFMKKKENHIMTNGIDHWSESVLVSINNTYSPIECNESTKCIGRVLGKAIVID